MLVLNYASKNHSSIKIAEHFEKSTNTSEFIKLSSSAILNMLRYHFSYYFSIIIKSNLDCLPAKRTIKKMHDRSCHAHMRKAQKENMKKKNMADQYSKKCEPCGKQYSGVKQYEDQVRSKKHIDTIIRFRNGDLIRWSICNIEFNLSKNLNEHLRRKKYMDKACGSAGTGG